MLDSEEKLDLIKMNPHHENGPKIDNGPKLVHKLEAVGMVDKHDMTAVLMNDLDSLHVGNCIDDSLELPHNAYNATNEHTPNSISDGDANSDTNDMEQFQTSVNC